MLKILLLLSVLASTYAEAGENGVRDRMIYGCNAALNPCTVERKVQQDDFNRKQAQAEFNREHAPNYNDPDQQWRRKREQYNDYPR